MDCVTIVNWQSDLINTKESILSVCDKPYHTNKRNVQKGEIEILRKNTFFTESDVQNAFIHHSPEKDVSS